MELSIRKHLQIKDRKVDIEKAVDEIMTCEEVLSCWSLICSLETAKSDKLLLRLAEKWVTLRGFSYVVEQYKQHSKGKSLRKTLKM